MCNSDVPQHSVAYVYKRGRRKTYSLVVCNNSVLQKTIPWIVVPIPWIVVPYVIHSSIGTTTIGTCSDYTP